MNKIKTHINTNTPTPTPALKPTPTPTPTSTLTLTQTPIPTPTPTSTLTLTPTPTPTRLPTPTTATTTPTTKLTSTTPTPTQQIDLKICVRQQVTSWETIPHEGRKVSSLRYKYIRRPRPTNVLHTTCPLWYLRIYYPGLAFIYFYLLLPWYMLGIFQAKLLLWYSSILYLPNARLAAALEDAVPFPFALTAKCL